MTYFLIDPKNESEPFIISDFDQVNYWRTNYPECIMDSSQDEMQLAFDYGLIKK